MKVPAERLSEQEFKALPPTLRRKYFSSLERLRLAQDGAFPAPSSPRMDKMLSQGGLAHRLPRPSVKRKASYPTRLSSRRLLRKSQSVKSQYRASQIDATWFSSLPQKIQQCQFSREEQALLAGKRDIVIPDAADEAVHRFGRQRNISARSLCTDTAFHSGRHNKSRNGSAAEEARDPAFSMDDSFFDSLRWLDEDDDFDLTLADYHNAVSETVNHPPPETERLPSGPPPLPKTLGNPRRNSASVKRPHTSHSAVAPSGLGLGAPPLLTSPPTPRHQRQSSASSLEPVAQHYKDPEARLKLRVYLASPQKFDEALEFGFPSLDSTAGAQPPAAPAHPGRFKKAERSFFVDAASSPQEDKAGEDEDISLADIDGPPTPQDTIFQLSGPWKQNSLDGRGILPAHIPRTWPDPHMCKPSGGREMTLHMTLTRPDLRTETRIRPVTGEKDDPLKLSDLHLSDESRPIWESMPDDQSKVKRLWKKLTSR